MRKVYVVNIVSLPWMNLHPLCADRMPHAADFLRLSFASLYSSLRHLFGGVLYGLHDVLISVQRHRVADIPQRISSSEGCGFFWSSAYVDISMPGVQNPHCITVFFLEAFLQWMDAPSFTAFHGHDVSAIGLNGEHVQTLPSCRHDHRACAAVAGITADVRSRLSQRFTDKVDQQQARFSMARGLCVDFDLIQFFFAIGVASSRACFSLGTASLELLFGRRAQEHGRSAL